MSRLLDVSPVLLGGKWVVGWMHAWVVGGCMGRSVGGWMVSINESQVSFRCDYKVRSPVCKCIQKYHVLHVKDPVVHVRV